MVSSSLPSNQLIWHLAISTVVAAVHILMHTSSVFIYQEGFLRTRYLVPCIVGTLPFTTLCDKNINPLIKWMCSLDPSIVINWALLSVIAQDKTYPPMEKLQVQINDLF